MEIIMKNLSVRSLKDYQKLNHVDYVFKDSAITFCNGLSGALIKDLLFKKKNPLNGYLLVNECGHASDIGYLGNEVLKEFEMKNALDEMKYLNEIYDLEIIDVVDKGLRALMMVGLSQEFLMRDILSMSRMEQKKVWLACVLFYNPKVIIVDYYFKGFNYKDKESLKKVFKRLKSKYKKNIIIFDDENEDYLDVVDNYVVFRNGKIVLECLGNDCYNEKLYRYMKMPKIIEFVKMARKNGHELLDYVDVKELIKAIYRDVEAK